MERFKDLVLECPHHGLNTWHLCQIIYEGIDHQTKQLVESMCPDGFTSYTDEKDAWNFLLDLGERTREWESAQVSERALPSKGYVIEGAVAKEAQLDSLATRLESLIRGSTQVNQINQNTPMCSWCQSPSHVIEECQSYIENQYTHENVSAMNQYNPYSNTYNPGWRNHPNFSWNQGQNMRGQSSFLGQPSSVGAPPPHFPEQPSSFPSQLEKNKKAPAMEKIIDTFKQVQVNIPLLEAIEQVPSYAKVLKDLCTKKRILQTPKKAFLADNITAMFSQPTMRKYKDPGCPTISCVIGNTKIDHALLDLGASVNLLHSTVFEQLGLGELVPTNTTLQLADRSVKVPRGKIEDVLIKVGVFNYFIILA
ncbi:gag-asp_proteas domain-containing protein [Cephalotus follicularis]|uniref:Gag-asp_proteas domain-containing protein n=1 Tax=Cephalotus follicularis TaxID=3775 RepID=A0A1Q3AYL6_CEPFO|nr:gag-asp_proteas domain-containing protein [Cephalotus follicularis]